MVGKSWSEDQQVKARIQKIGFGCGDHPHGALARGSPVRLGRTRRLPCPTKLLVNLPLGKRGLLAFIKEQQLL